MRETEREILKRFAKSGQLKGTFLLEVPVGFQSTMTLADQDGISSSKDIISGYSIDAVCVEGNNTEILELSHEQFFSYADAVEGCPVWLIEVESKLNPTAIGQILVYKDLFIDDYSGGPRANYNLPISGIGIVCQEANRRLVIAAGRLGIKVFT